MATQWIFALLGGCVLISPLVLFGVLGGTALAERPLGERAISRWTEATVCTGLLAALGILASMLASGVRFVPVELGSWCVLEQQHFHLTLKFVFDRLSVPFVILSCVLCGTIGAFASEYLHREPGYRRFFLLLAVFLLGMTVTSLAGTIETLFLGWELVGLSSALLVGFYHERSAPVRNALQVWIVYRVADAAFLCAAVALHHVTGEGDFSGLMGTGPWPAGRAALSSNQALIIGALLLVAAAGKSALVPFSGWLPRAMEGPTPSSAVFYGALSVHLGAFLLLRTGPIWVSSVVLSASVVALGLTTALFATIAGRVQTDIKSALAFASLTQVGIIVAEIGLGFRYLALVHIIGHACLRTLQLVRAPTLLHDYHTLENAMGAHLSSEERGWSRMFSLRMRVWFYRLALGRGYFDVLLLDYVARPIVRLFRTCDEWERKWTNLLAGGPPRASHRAPGQPEAVEEPL